MIKHWIEDPSEWRLNVSKIIAEHLDFDHFAVEGIYLIGSTKRFAAGPGSDIDLLIHFNGNQDQRKELLAWLTGWGECLAMVNSAIVGTNSGNLLDVHLVSDEDIRNKSSFGVMIYSLHDRAKPLKVK